MHDTRVAARRFLAAGNLWVPEAVGWSALHDRLTRWIRRLGRVRNFDVVIRLLRLGDRDRPARKALERALRKRRRRERERLAAWLTRRRLEKLEDAVAELVRRVRTKSPAPVPAPADLSPHFMKILALCALGPWSQDTDAGHEVRREVRRLRYAHETLAWSYAAEDFRRTRSVLLQVQDLAGSWRDRCVLQRLAAKALSAGRISVPLVDFLSRTQSEANGLAAKFAMSVTRLMDLRPLIVGEEA